MSRIDAHQHFWHYDPVRDGWIDENMSLIQRDFLPEHLQPILQQHNFNGCVTVQSDQSEAETIFQLNNAEKNGFIKGVVGWVDLKSDDIEDKLAELNQYPKLKGLRHILQGEPDRALMLQPAFKNGINKLNKFSYTYDVLIFPDQLKYTAELVSAFPNQPFVINHLAKPYIKDQKVAEWEKEIKAIAAYENVFCKISGLVTEANWQKWDKADLRPYLDVVIEAFGTKRIMFGSDWPVCLVAATYSQVLEIVTEYFSAFSATEQELFFGVNATSFYNLNP